jgi:macrolide-specific efflux system membrane fusion protein
MRMSGKKWVISIVAVIVIAVAAYLIMRGKKSDVVYKEHTVANGELEISVQATGTVQPENRLVVKPQIAGRIDKILVEEGQRVKAGQILAWMSSNDRAALMDMASSAGDDEKKRWEEIYKPSPIIAPLGGIIIAKNVERGQTVSTGDTAFIISDRLIIQAQVDETDLSQISPGQSAEIRVDAYSGEPVTGKVIRIAYESKQVNNVTIYEIRLLPDTVPPFMRSGMTTSVKFLKARRDNALLLPVSFLRSKAPGITRDFDPKKETTVTVLLKDPAGKSEPAERDVRVGISNGKYFEVLSGLSAGDVILQNDTNANGDKKSANPFSPFGAPRPGRR